LEPLNPTQAPPVSGPIPRKRKASGEFLTALNLLADTYGQSAQLKQAGERPKRIASAHLDLRNSDNVS